MNIIKNLLVNIKNPNNIANVKAKLNNENGQGLVEFSLISIVFIFVLFITINILIAFSIHQYVSYVAFMGARAYQASAQTPDENRVNALSTLNSFFGQISGSGAVDIPLKFAGFNTVLATITNVNVPNPQDFDYGAGGDDPAYYIGIDFEIPIFAFPLGNILDGLSSIPMKTKSFLGREVSEMECRNYFQTFISKFSGGNPNYDPSLYVHMYDNGC